MDNYNNFERWFKENDDDFIDGNITDSNNELYDQVGWFERVVYTMLQEVLVVCIFFNLINTFCVNTFNVYVFNNISKKKIRFLRRIRSNFNETTYSKTC